MGTVKIETSCDRLYNELILLPSKRSREALRELRDKAIKELNEVSGKRPFVLYAKPDYKLDATKDRLWLYIGWSEGFLTNKEIQL